VVQDVFGYLETKLLKAVEMINTDKTKHLQLLMSAELHRNINGSVSIILLC